MKDFTVMVTTCNYCSESYSEGEQIIIMTTVRREAATVLSFHVECQMRGIVGSVGHLLHRCPCFGGTSEDPPGLNRREAAKLAAETYYRLQREAVGQEASR